ncbi:MAG: hypothetical protein FWD67_08820 [Betaproteobacteria bacterium]|nr:hypothetical protein [Betaproteobacteria bacterium]
MKRLPHLFACACLAGCVAANGEPVSGGFPPLDISKAHYGVFVGVGPAIEAGIANEAALQLWHIYPPPKNLPDFQQRVADTDSFGRLLVKALQRDGYFVHQWFDPAVSPECGKKPAMRGSGDFRVVPVCYLVDDVSGMLRLTLYTAGDAWSRFFETEQGKLKPVGAWTQQKGE